MVVAAESGQLSYPRPTPDKRHQSPVPAAAVAAAAELGLGLWLQTEPATMAAAHRLHREAMFVAIPPYQDLGVAGAATLGLHLPRGAPCTSS
jgi:hypothetical protein